jgi:hypothetical protein
MTDLNLVIHPDTLLRESSSRVEDIDDEVT